MSMPSPPAISTRSFGGAPYPPEIVARIIDMLISGAPFAASLTRQPTSRASVVWPTVGPTGWSWLNELDKFPTVDVGDDKYEAIPRKLGGLVDLSNESVGDAAINLVGQLADRLRDSLSRDMDLGLLTGGAPPKPPGVLNTAPEAAGADLLSAVAVARGAIGDAGGAADKIALSATMLAEADTARTDTGFLLYANGFAAAAQLTPVVVPGLGSDFGAPLVFDSTRCYTVVRDDPRVDWSTDFRFDYDVMTIRIKARVTAAIPNPAASIRQLAIGDEARTAPAAKRSTAKS
jgi:HK97 family phage major capsid protein